MARRGGNPWSKRPQSSLCRLYVLLLCLLIHIWAPTVQVWAFSLHRSPLYSSAAKLLPPAQGGRWSSLTPLHPSHPQSWQGAGAGASREAAATAATPGHASEENPEQAADQPHTPASEPDGSAAGTPTDVPRKKSSGAAPLFAAVASEAKAAAEKAVADAVAESGRRVALLAAPRGFCQGVRRAVGTVEEALRVFGPPVYVKHQIVHNEHVCKDLESRGAVFVESIEDIPPNSVVVFSAHGIPPEVRDAAAARNLRSIDATCPLVQKVHVYVQQKAKEGYQIIIIGHKNHVEVHGVRGEAPEVTQVVESVEDVEALSYPPNSKLFYVTQTTLSLLDCMKIEQALRAKYPSIQTIPSGSVCYATTNRQAALGALAEHAQLALVVGSEASSNAKRLVEVAKAKGIPAYLIGQPEDIDPAWLMGVSRVVVSASASTPESLTASVMKHLADLGLDAQREALAVMEKVPTWKLPKDLRDAAKAVDAASGGSVTNDSTSR